MALRRCKAAGGAPELHTVAERFVKDLLLRLRASPTASPDINAYRKAFLNALNLQRVEDVDLFVRSSGEQRTSNFLVWQSAYAELVFLDRLWPDFDRRDLWRAIELYVNRDRRFGGAIPNETGETPH